MLKIRRPLGRLIFNMGIAIPGKTVFLIETAPWSVYNQCHGNLLELLKGEAYSEWIHLSKLLDLVYALGETLFIRIKLSMIHLRMILSPPHLYICFPASV